MSDESSGLRDRALAVLSTADEWLERHPRTHLALYVVVPGGAVALAFVTVGGERPVVALFSGGVFGLLYGTLTYFWTGRAG